MEHNAAIGTFIDDDAGYLAWLAAHPVGFVVNAEREPNAGYLVLHCASCPTISKTPHPAGAWTERQYIKMCADRIADLERWALSRTGGKLQHCQTCNPGLFSWFD